MSLNPRITSNRFDYRFSQIACFTSAPIVLTCAVVALGRFGAAPSEFLVGILSAAALGVGMVLLGFVGSPKNPVS